MLGATGNLPNVATFGMKNDSTVLIGFRLADHPRPRGPHGHLARARLRQMPCLKRPLGSSARLRRVRECARDGPPCAAQAASAGPLSFRDSAVAAARPPGPCQCLEQAGCQAPQAGPCCEETTQGTTLAPCGNLQIAPCPMQRRE